MSNGPPTLQRVRRRAWLVLAGLATVLVVLPLAFGHRGRHAVLNILVPGAGLYGTAWGAGVALTLLAVGATVAWMRWGMDWTLVVVIVIAMVLSATLATSGGATGTAMPRTPMAHEFPLVVLVVAVLGWLAGIAGRVPLVRRVAVRRSGRSPALADAPPVLRARAVCVHALADGDVLTVGQVVDTAVVRTRARRVAVAARGRFRGDPLRRDHAHARASLALCGRLDTAAQAALVRDAQRSWAGVPCSEPGWIRPLDATLVAMALGDHPEIRRRWVEALTTVMPLRRGHRPAWIWAPLGLAAGAAPPWEHAASTAIARAAGWIGTDDDWTALRRRALGAAARGVATTSDERLIAAARCWLALVDDPAAAAILQRPTVRHDPLALALDALGRRLRDDPLALRANAIPHAERNPS